MAGVSAIVGCATVFGSAAGEGEPQSVQCFSVDANVNDSLVLMLDGSATWYTDHLLAEVRSGQVTLGANDTLRAALAIPQANAWRILTRSVSYTGDQLGPPGMLVVPLRFIVPLPRGSAADSGALVFVLARRSGIGFEPRLIVAARPCHRYLPPASADHVRGSSVPRTHTE